MEYPITQRHHWRHSSCKPENCRIAPACLHFTIKDALSPTYKSLLDRLTALCTQKLSLQFVLTINLYFSFHCPSLNAWLLAPHRDLTGVMPHSPLPILPPPPKMSHNCLTELTYSQDKETEPVKYGTMCSDLFFSACSNLCFSPPFTELLLHNF